ncbi:MAG TPA: DNA repair protein RecN [Candidatus Limnocylindrales bacterium]|nr:DNA repair protein RecN [Candidatus Limnocylindrales bacterium]
MSLLELAVTDLALLERVRLRLDPGFTVVTGETGAGKSLLIDALTLILGGRADSGVVRHGAPSARVEALFDRDPEPLICVREVAAGGRSMARIDDETVTVARLAEVAGPLVEIHGQHDQQRLLSAAWQRELLDGFGGHGELCVRVREAVGRWRENQAALAGLEIDPGELERRIELAEHAADEIAAAELRVGELDELRARLAATASAERIVRLCREARDLLLGDGAGARDRLAIAARSAAELAALEGSFAELDTRLGGLAAEVEDVAAELRRRSASIEHDSEAGAVMEERLGRIYVLLRKYGGDEAAVLEHGERARQEADRLAGLDRERADRLAVDEVLEHDAREAAEALTIARRSAAERLSGLATAALADLGFGKATLEVTVAPAGLEASGADAVAFVFAPNPGEPGMPLARIASGGELSRVALALKSVLAEADATPTLVFDEIDAGVGGRSAAGIGRMLHRLAASHQVVCVTHLPQIAAHADSHVRIAKRTEGERTITIAEPLDEQARIDELAAMLGGEAVGGAGRDGARELRARARADERRPVLAR